MVNAGEVKMALRPIVHDHADLLGNAATQFFGQPLRDIVFREEQQRHTITRRDLLLMDNRGTGRTAVIDCHPLQEAPESTVRNIAQCGRDLGAAAPLYSSAYSADDLAALLQALGRRKVDLYGDSYGTYFSQIFAYRHPGLLRTLVLDSAYPVPMVGGETPWYPLLAGTMRDKFNLGCARSPGCRELPGDSLGRIEAVLGQFEGGRL
eukprot:gene1904-2501_t